MRERGGVTGGDAGARAALFSPGQPLPLFAGAQGRWFPWHARQGKALRRRLQTCTRQERKAKLGWLGPLTEREGRNFF
jgi:hypothetical protein